MSGQYKTFGKQEENIYNYEEMQQTFYKRDVDAALEENKERIIREANQKYQEKLERITKKKNKAMAIALSVMVAGGAIGFGIADKDKTPDVMDNSIGTTDLQYENASYDKFIVFCQYYEDITGIALEQTQEEYEKTVRSGELQIFIDSGEYAKYMENNGARRI